MKRLYQRGMSLISSVLGILALAAITATAFKYTRVMNTDAGYKDRGVQFVTVLEGLKQYALRNRSNLFSGRAIPGYTAYSPTIEQLKAGGLISQNFNPSTDAKLGGEIKTMIKVEPSGCTSNCLITLYVLPSDSIVGNNSQPDFSASNAIADGMKGFGWSNSPTMPQILAKGNMSIPNPLGNKPAIALAAYWIPSNQTLDNVTSTENQTLPCPAPLVGVIVQTRTKIELQAGGYEYSDWVTISQTCAIPPPPPTCSNGASDYPTCTPPTCANGASDWPTCTPPVCANGASDYPTCTPPKCANGASDWPTCTPSSPPKCANGASDYPTCTPPKCSNGASDWPTCTPPKCANGASDYPTCTPPFTPICANGATNYPTCTTPLPPVCANGANNYPICTFPQPPVCSNGANNYPTCTFPRKKYYCKVGPWIDDGYPVAAVGEFVPYDPNTDYIGGNVLSSGWEFSYAGQYTSYDAMWCTGGNGN